MIESKQLIFYSVSISLVSTLKNHISWSSEENLPSPFGPPFNSILTCNVKSLSISLEYFIFYLHDFFLFFAMVLCTLSCILPDNSGVGTFSNFVRNWKLCPDQCLLICSYEFDCPLYTMFTYDFAQNFVRTSPDVRICSYTPVHCRRFLCFTLNLNNL